jgi:transcriptional regulator with PAS, ATPase and Fis domain
MTFPPAQPRVSVRSAKGEASLQAPWKDIAFIAPYESLRTKAQSIIETNAYPARSFLGDMQAGVTAARVAIEDGAKIIISRGGTARLIREQLKVDVVEVGVSTYRVLAYIHEQTTGSTRIAVVGFRQFINLVQPVCDILKRTHQTFEIRKDVPMEWIIAQVMAWKADVVIGDAISVRWAQRHGLTFHLIESSMEAIVDAFERAMLVLNNLRKHIADAQKMVAVLNCTREGALLINGDGLIEEINRRGCELLRAARPDLIGKSFRELFQANELDAAVRSGRSAKNVLLLHQAKRLAVDYVVIAPEAKASSGVILFQQVEQIQETGNAIRKKLLEKGFYAKYTFADILHQSDGMIRLLDVARQYSRTGCNIMIQGETGTGKELFAQSIHNDSPLAGGPFVAVNCAALSGSLLESELFGYAPGAFTGALSSGKTGLFELAHGGTLFLDEITEMDIFLQAKLLRALQSREIMRIGDDRIIPVSVRVISASNRDPGEAVRAGTLRADLFFRLNVLDLTIPPLRDRGSDASFLFLHYIEKHGGKRGVRVKKPSDRYLREIDRYAWPGNVRELENLAEKYVALHDLPHGRAVPAHPRPAAASEPADRRAETLDEIVAQAVAEAFARANGNISKTAVRLGVDRNTVKRWLAKTDR